MRMGGQAMRTATYEGIYEIPETARYLLATKMADKAYRVSSRKLIRWIRHGLILPSLAEVPGRQLLIAFEDVVSMRVIAALRAAGLSFPKIYAAEKWLRAHTGEKRPFASEVLWTERSEVLIDLQAQLIAASRHGQLAMDILRTYIIPIHGLTFGDNQVAASWEPVPGILLHPAIHFGAPCLKNTRIPTRPLWGMAQAGDSFEWLAEAYRLSEGEVHTAIDWEERLAA